MFYVRIGPNRSYIINEFWILIPVSFGIQYFLLKKVNELEKKRVKSFKRRIQKQNIYEFAVNNYRFELHRLMLLINVRVRGVSLLARLQIWSTKASNRIIITNVKKSNPVFNFLMIETCTMSW